jgi:nucleoid-associated protein YgaU
MVEKRVLSRRRRITHASRTKASAKLRLLSLILVSILVVGVAGHLVFGPEALAADEPNIISVTVGAGDSVWSIASEYGDSDTDVRKTVKQIYELNGISAEDSLFPGMTLEVPVAV